MQDEISSGIPKRQYFHNINGLRFVGAISILIFHCVTLPGDIWGDFHDGYWFQKFHFIFSRGHLGIIMFYVLSGFLITNILLWEFKTRGKINTFKFFIRRFLRVWPLYFLLIAFGFFLFPKMPYGIETVHELWRFVLFLSNFDEIIMGPYDPINFLSATWSIGVEEQFYIVWGILMTIFTLRGRLKVNTIYLFSVGVILGALTFRYFHMDDGRVLYYHTLSVMSDLAFGCIIGVWAFSGKAEIFFKKLDRWKIILFYILAIILLIYEGHIFKGPLFLFERITPAVIFAIVILEQVYSENSFFKLDKFPLFFFSGEITYGFYIVHSIYIYYWATFFDLNGYTEHIWQFAVFILLVFSSTYLTSTLSYFAIEKPIFKLRKYFR